MVIEPMATQSPSFAASPLCPPSPPSPSPPKPGLRTSMPPPESRVATGSVSVCAISEPPSAEGPEGPESPESPESDEREDQRQIEERGGEKRGSPRSAGAVSGTAPRPQEGRPQDQSTPRG